MKKKISVLLVFLMLFVPVILLSGCSNKAVDACKEVMDEYYEAYDDSDSDDIIDLFHDNLIDEFDTKENLEITLMSTITILGEIDEYKLVGTSYYKNSGEVSVVLEYEVTYERSGETYIEQYEFLNDGDEMKISGISYEIEDVYYDVPDAFFEAYSSGDTDALLDSFSDALFTYITEDELISLFNEVIAVYGSYKEHVLTEEWNYYEIMQEDDVIVVYEETFDVAHEEGNVEFIMQLCIEDDEIKINYISWTGE